MIAAFKDESVERSDSAVRIAAKMVHSLSMLLLLRQSKENRINRLFEVFAVGNKFFQNLIIMFPVQHLFKI